MLKDGDVILTHCNVSGSMPLIAEFAKQDGKRISFYVTERGHICRVTFISLGAYGQKFEPLLPIIWVAYLLSLGKVTR